MTLIRVDELRRASTGFVILIVAAAFAAVFPAAVSLPDSTAVLFRPMAGLLVGVLLVTEVRYWWLVCLVVAAFEVLSAIGPLTFDAQPGTLAEVFTWFVVLVPACWLLRQRYADGLALDRVSPGLRDFMIFALFAGISVGLLQLAMASLAGTVPTPGSAWLQRGVSLGASVLLVAPPIVAWPGLQNQRSPAVSLGMLELLVVALVISALVALAAFASSMVSQGLYVFLPVTLLWAAVRFELRSAALLPLWTAVNIAVAQRTGAGPFEYAAADASIQALASTVYVSICAIVLLLISALVAGRPTSQPADNQKQETPVESSRQDAFASHVAGLVHDWNNHMLVLSFQKDELEERAALDHSLDGSVDALATIVVDGRRLAIDLADFAQREARPEACCDLNEAVSTGAELARHVLPPGKQLVALCGNCNGPLVRAEPAHLRQIVLVLALRAGESMGAAGGTIVIEVDGPMPGELNGRRRAIATITVTCKGPGYTRIEQEASVLGLSLVQCLVDILGWTMENRSAESPGNVVIVTLPTIAAVV